MLMTGYNLVRGRAVQDFREVFSRRFNLPEPETLSAVSLLRHEQIKTTVPNAKELRKVVEPLITLAGTASVANRRTAFARLRDREMVSKLFDDLGPHFADRPGGYTRILKCGYRSGDNAPMALVELVDRPEESQAAAE